MLLRVCVCAVERRPWEAFGRVRHDAVERFGGATAVLRSPAAGQWRDDDGGVSAFLRTCAVEPWRDAMAG